MSNQRICSSKGQKPHNLNIQMYSFQDILNLFEIGSQISLEDLKRAKMKVLMTHPDKSRLPSDYFLFYKKAFDIVVEFYQSQTKESQEVTAENAQYSVLPNTTYDKNTHRKIGATIKKMDVTAFNDKFNALFDQNMSTSMRAKDRNNDGWFKDETAQYDTANVGKNVNQGIETVKAKQQQMRADVAVYAGVQTLHSGGHNLYDDDDDDDDPNNTNSGTYITSDPFSKLKYDDLRKVHKNETVFSVSERDLEKMPKYSSVDQFTKERNRMDLAPLEKPEAQIILERQHAERIMRKEYEAKLQSMKYAEKNKSVLASFLHLGN